MWEAAQMSETVQVSEFQRQARRKAEEVAKLTGWQLPDGWGIGPVGQHRDSDSLERSNFDTALQILENEEGAADDVEVFRFGHWAVGWVEEIGFRLGTPAAARAEEIAQRLEDYPVLDEDDFSAREWADDHPEGDSLCYSDYCRSYGWCSEGRELA